MTLIKNFGALNSTPQRKICLELVEAALSSIQPQTIIQKNFSLSNSILTIKEKTIDLKKFERVFLLGFGKGSAGLSKNIENILGNLLTEGYVIDLEPEQFSKIQFTLGTHPLPSENNLSFTKKTIERLSNLSVKDLVVVVVCGGGSALFVNPYRISMKELIETNRVLLRSGAGIAEIVTVRKHTDIVKGGGLAKLLYPAKIVALIVSDVPGNNLSVIASGPTVSDPTTKKEVFAILQKYHLWDKLNLSKDDFLETPKEDKYFNDILNILILSNKTAISAMEQKAKELGFNTLIYSDKFQSEAKIAGETLIENTPSHTILLAGGETTVKVLHSNGKGGRNQELVLAALEHLDENTTIASFDTDGWDNTEFAGAIGDFLTIRKVKDANINPQSFLQENNSFSFFEKTEDGIITGRLPSNVSDLMIVLKK